MQLFFILSESPYQHYKIWMKAVISLSLIFLFIKLYPHQTILTDMKSVGLSSKNIVYKMFLYTGSFILTAEKASRICKAITAIWKWNLTTRNYRPEGKFIILWPAQVLICTSYSWKERSMYWIVLLCCVLNVDDNTEDQKSIKRTQDV